MITTKANKFNGYIIPIFKDNISVNGIAREDSPQIAYINTTIRGFFLNILYKVYSFYEEVKKCPDSQSKAARASILLLLFTHIFDQYFPKSSPREITCSFAFDAAAEENPEPPWNEEDELPEPRL